MSLIETVVSHIVQTRFEDLPQELIDRAKDRIIDTLGCIFAGVDYPAYKMIIDLMEEWAGKEESTIMGRGAKTPPPMRHWQIRSQPRPPRMMPRSPSSTKNAF